jgi:molecular chaperone Hsp33
MKPIEFIKQQALDRLSIIESDGVTRFTLLSGTIKGALLSATRLCTTARIRHELGIIESLALSQALIGSALYALQLKEGFGIQMRVDCTGVLKGWNVEANWKGEVKGHLFNPLIPLDHQLDSFDLKPFINTGTLTVRRFSANGVSYSGTIELKKGRIAEDLTDYWLRSEQTASSLSLSVRYGRDGAITGACGLFLQALLVPQSLIWKILRTDWLRWGQF